MQQNETALLSADGGFPSDGQLDRMLDDAEREYRRIAREGNMREVLDALAHYVLDDLGGLEPFDRTAERIARRAQDLLREAGPPT